MSLFTRHKIMKRLSSDDGQALVEAPVAMLLLMMMLLILLQPAVWLYSLCLLNGAAGSACRLAATDRSYGSGPELHAAMIETWVVQRKLGGLPEGSFFQAERPEVKISGSQNDFVTAEVTVKQRPIPLIGILFAQGFGGIDNEGHVTLTAKASAPGSRRGVAGNPDDPSPWYGQEP